MTCSPFKNSLLDVNKKRAQDSTWPKKTLFDRSTPGEPSYSGKKTVAEMTETENIFCPRCDERYEEPITEDWIQCVKCQRWWHEQCSSFKGGIAFKCDIC
jgi:hypothetical protein